MKGTMLLFGRLSALQDLYSAWIDQGLDWVALHGQENADTPVTPAMPQPQDLSLSPEQLQLITDYFCKVQHHGITCDQITVVMRCHATCCCST